MKEAEEWKSLDFLGYPNYEVSNFGKVKSMNYNRTGKEKILKQSKNRWGYLYVTLSKDNKQKKFTIHRLVALAFIPNDNPTDKNQINHLDENKENNHVFNLCWCSHIENINYGTRNERVSEKLKDKPLPEEQKQKMCIPIIQLDLKNNFIRDWDSATSASEELKIYQQNITACCKGKRKSTGGFIWKYKE